MMYSKILKYIKMFKSESDSLNIFCIYVSYSWPNGSTELADVFKETHRYPGGNKGKKMSSKIDLKKNRFFKIPRATPDTLSSN